MAKAEKSELINVIVTARREGFRRAGRAWSSTPAQAEVTPTEMEQLKAEPMLMVQVDGEKPKAKAE